MKKIIFLVAFILPLTTISLFAQNFECSAPDNYSAKNSNSCSLTSADIFNCYSASYDIVFHFIGDANGKNFTCNANDPIVNTNSLLYAPTFMYYVRKEMNERMEKAVLNAANIDAKVKFEYLNGSGCNSAYFYTSGQNPQLVNNAFNIVFKDKPNSTLLGGYTTYGSKTVYINNALKKLLAGYNEWWNIGRVVNHEFGHTRGLKHTFNCSNPCDGVDGINAQNECCGTCWPTDSNSTGCWGCSSQELIMSYGSQVYFTECELQEMWCYIINNPGSHQTVTNSCNNLPDLRVYNQTSTPTSGSSGSTVSLTSRVKNFGTAASGYSYLKYYLSTNTTYGSTDTYLGLDYVTALSAGSNSYETFSFNIPSNLSGTYYILFVADANGQVNESSETNNVAYKTLTITGCPEPTTSQNTTNSITQTTARLNCSASGSYRDFRYRTSTTWTNVTHTTASFKDITGLSAGTTYYWQSRVYCNGQWSTWSNDDSFTTSASCSPPTSSQNTTSNITATSARLNTSAPGSYRDFQYRVSGTTTWINVTHTTASFKTITGLTASTTYQWRSRAYCPPWSGWSPIETFTTSSSCSRPTAAQNTTSNITASSARLNCSASGNFRDFQYRVSGTTTWINVTHTTASYKTITGLTASTTYQWRSRAYCPPWTSYSVIETFTTSSNCTPATPTSSQINNSGNIYCTYAYGICNGHSGDYKHFQLRNQSTGAYTNHYTTLHYVYLGNLTAGTPYRYRVRLKCGTTGSYGGWSPYRYFSTTTTCLTGDSEASSASKKATISDNSLSGITPSLSNYPNPFNGVTTIEFELPEETDVSLFVSDITGKRVAILVNNELRTSGLHQVTFDGSNLPSGIYHYSIQVGDQLVSRKMIITK